MKNVSLTSCRVWLVVALLAIFCVPALAQDKPYDTTPPDSRAIIKDNPGTKPNEAPPLVDPTKNVLDLVGAAIARQDDLRTVIQGFTQKQFDTTEKLNELRYKQTQELAAALANKLADEAKLRSDYSDRLAIAEAKRIDAIRAVDVNAVAVANERATATATALAKTVADSALVLSAQVTRQADDLRVLVKTTADESNRNLQQQFSAITTQAIALSTRITSLEQSGAEGKGKQTVADPALIALVQEVRTLAQRDQSRTGVDTGRNDTIYIIAALFMGLLALGGFLMNVFKPKAAKP